MASSSTPLLRSVSNLSVLTSTPDQKHFERCLAQAKADEKNYEACYQLGMCYKDGRGCTQNDAHAFTWFSKAAKGENHELALCELGDCYTKGVKKKEYRAKETAAYYYGLAANLGNEGKYRFALYWKNFHTIGDPDARGFEGSFFVGTYGDGDVHRVAGYGESNTMAAELLRMAADGGHIGAQKKIIYDYLFGPLQAKYKMPFPFINIPGESLEKRLENWRISLINEMFKRCDGGYDMKIRSYLKNSYPDETKAAEKLISTRSSNPTAAVTTTTPSTTCESKSDEEGASVAFRM